MVVSKSLHIDKDEKVSPVCPLFGQCGGCQYQDIPYDQQLRLKEHRLAEVLTQSGIDGVIEPIVPSPREYNYRCRMDIKFLRTRKNEYFMGFSPIEHYHVIEAAACPIAMQTISDFLPELKRLAIERLPQKYRNANLVVKTGDDGRVYWGGIGRRSLRMAPEEYLWTEVDGKRIFFSLDSFFQANLSILPELMRYIKNWGILTPETLFYDLYGGVGLFGVCFHDIVAEVVLIEENIYAARLAQFNAEQNRLDRFRVHEGRLEDHLSLLEQENDGKNIVAMIDPPRNGLSPQAAGFLAHQKYFQHLLYLSCQPESLARDLRLFKGEGWKSVKIIPFDFFPQTKHLETLVWLSS